MRAMSANFVGVGAIGASGCARIIQQELGLALTPSLITDPVVFNFALNLEYLEAEYYLRGVTGQTLDQATGTNLGGTVRGGRQVNFISPVRKAFVEDIARNELAHVNFLRTTMGSRAIQRPTINLDASFQAVAQAAGIGGFDPFANETNF